MPAGRPSEYSDDLATEICIRLSQGDTLIAICREDGMPDKATVFRWLAKNLEFRDKYARARDEQSDVFAEETVDIADNTNDPAKARVQIDARKWFASKVAPKKYGDKTAHELSGPNGQPIATSLEISFVSPPADTVSEET